MKGFLFRVPLRGSFMGIQGLGFRVYRLPLKASFKGLLYRVPSYYLGFRAEGL